MSEKKPSKFSAVLSGTPKKYILFFGNLLGSFFYCLDSRHRRIAYRNLNFAYPELSNHEIKRLCRRIFKNVAVTSLEICQMSFFSKDDVLKNVKIEGANHLISAAENPNGVIMITAHLGNWEMAAVFTCCYLEKPFVAIARALQSERFGQWLNRIRTRFGNTIVDKKGALPKMARTLRSGKMLGILIDQETSRNEGVTVNFFGKKCLTTPGAALLARRYRCPVVPGFCVRGKDGILKLVVKAPLSLTISDDAQRDIQANTQLMTNAIEDAVREYPDQWLWFHKRWKRNYPDLYAEDILRRRRRREKRVLKSKREGN